MKVQDEIFDAVIQELVTADNIEHIKHLILPLKLEALIDYAILEVKDRPINLIYFLDNFEKFPEAYSLKRGFCWDCWKYHGDLFEGSEVDYRFSDFGEYLDDNLGEILNQTYSQELSPQELLSLSKQNRFLLETFYFNDYLTERLLDTLSDADFKLWLIVDAENQKSNSSLFWYAFHRIMKNLENIAASEGIEALIHGKDFMQQLCYLAPVSYLPGVVDLFYGRGDIKYPPTFKKQFKKYLTHENEAVRKFAKKVIGVADES